MSGAKAQLRAPEEIQKRWDNEDRAHGVNPNSPASRTYVHLLIATINNQMLDVMARAIANRTLQARDEHATQTKKLEARVAQLEAALAERKYYGVWRERGYKAHNSVTHDGSVWIALEDTASRPGDDETWQLAVKKGRDGR
jgi:hypothetical protein